MSRDDNKNAITILLCGQTTIGQKFIDSFCQVLINFETMTHSIDNQPHIQKHMTAACKNTSIGINNLISGDCIEFGCSLYYKNRYLILFSEILSYESSESDQIESTTKIVSYDTKRFFWGKYKYNLQFG